MNNKYYIFFSKLSNKLRIEIINALQEKPKTVSQLVKELRAEQSKLSHALKELRDCNIVNSISKGKLRIYKLNKTIIPILKIIDKHSKKYCKNKCKKCIFCKN